MSRSRCTTCNRPIAKGRERFFEDQPYGPDCFQRKLANQVAQIEKGQVTEQEDFSLPTGSEVKENA